MRLPAPVPSHRLKLARATEHLEALQETVRNWADLDPCAVIAESEVETRRQAWNVRVLIPAPTDRISMLVGDVLHNLRQTIDHLAYSLAWQVRGVEPPENTGFPITDDIEHFMASLGNIGPRRRMDPALIAALERVQPYHGRDFPALVALKEMHDLDKHRRVTVVGAGAAHTLTHVGSLSLSGDTTMLGTGYYKDGTPLIEHFGAMNPESKVDVNFEITPDVLFGKGTPRVPDQPVLGVLWAMRNVIAKEIAGPLEAFL